jgi:hypothetical protein
MTVSAENSQQLHESDRIGWGGEDTHHGNVKDVSFDGETKTTGMSPLIGTDEHACRYYGRGISERMSCESFKVLNDTLIVH